MAILATINPKEDFIVQMNGDYNVAFDEVEITVAGKSGDVIAVGDTFGILAEDKEAGAKRVRVLVRGNPTTVNGKALNYTVGEEQPLVESLADQNIIVVNR